MAHRPRPGHRAALCHPQSFGHLGMRYFVGWPGRLKQQKVSSPSSGGLSEVWVGAGRLLPGPESHDGGQGPGLSTGL